MVLAESALITGLTWSQYQGGSAYAGTNIAFYSALPPSPATLLGEVDAVATRTPNGQSAFGLSGQTYTVEGLSLPLPAGTHFLRLSNDTGGDPVRSAETVGTAQTVPGSYWHSGTWGLQALPAYDVAFRVRGLGGNHAPTADAGPDPTVYRGEPVLLDGSGSSDPQGTPLTYSWVLLSAPPGSSATLSGAATAAPTLLPDLDGTYTLVLAVSDGQLASPPDQVIVTVLPPTLRFTTASLPVGEGAGALTLIVERRGAPTETITVDLFSLDFSATAGLDYTALSGPLVFGPGVMSRGVTLTILDDADPEGDEELFVVLDDPDSGAVIAGTNPVSVVIADDEGGSAIISTSAPTLTVGEGDGTADVGVTRGGDTTGAAVVDYLVVPLTATDGSDYTAVAGTLAFAPGQTSAFIAIPLLDDALPEAAEQFTLVLDNPGGGSLGTPGVTDVTILDDDVAVPQTLSFSQAGYQVAEGAGSLLVTIQRSGSTSGTIAVDLTSFDLSASAGQDYSDVSGPIAIPDGQATLDVTIPILDDVLPEATEQFFLLLDNVPAGVSLGGTNPVAVEVLNDDAVPAQSLAFSQAAYAVGEAAGSLLVTVQRTGSTVGDITVDYFTFDLTATAPADYVPAFGTLTLGAGVGSATILLSLPDDADLEGPEVFCLGLENATAGVSLGGTNPVGIDIVDDD